MTLRFCRGGQRHRGHGQGDLDRRVFGAQPVKRPGQVFIQLRIFKIHEVMQVGVEAVELLSRIYTPDAGGEVPKPT